jgi:hypothetical protein
MRQLGSSFLNPNIFPLAEWVRDQKEAKGKRASSLAGARYMKWEQGLHSNHHCQPKCLKTPIIHNSSAPHNHQIRRHMVHGLWKLIAELLPVTCPTRLSITLHSRETRRDVWGTPPQISQHYVWSHTKHSIPQYRP